MFAQALRDILQPLPPKCDIPQDEHLQEAMNTLEVIVSLLLKEQFDTWRYEALDGILLTVAQRRDADTAFFGGDCILITDQTVSPIEVEVTLGGGGAGLVRVCCRVGEKQDGKLMRHSYDKEHRYRTLIWQERDPHHELEWMYFVERMYDENGR